MSSGVFQSLKETIDHEKMKRVESLVATIALSLNELSELCIFFATNMP